MKKKSITITIIVCAVILVATLLIIGGVFLFGRRVSNDEALDIVNDIVKDSLELNEIYFGIGLSFNDNGIESDDFSPVSAESPYQSRDDLEKKTYEIFSKEYAESIIDMAFMPQSSYGVSNFTRYTARGGSTDGNGYLYVYEKIEPTIEEFGEYDFSTTKIIKNSRSFIVAEITTKDGYTNRITLVYEGKENGESLYGGWRLDTSTYV
ncbi:MAG: hypothetical protein IJZ93_05455 [Clostridia bacterium]|nr:hypothetical protein [Clostridia bacterium]